MCARYEYLQGLSPLQVARVRRECRQSVALAFAGRHNQPRRARIVVESCALTLKQLDFVHGRPSC